MTYSLIDGIVTHLSIDDGARVFNIGRRRFQVRESEYLGLLDFGDPVRALITDRHGTAEIVVLQVSSWDPEYVAPHLSGRAIVIIGFALCTLAHLGGGWLFGGAGVALLLLHRAFLHRRLEAFEHFAALAVRGSALSAGRPSIWKQLRG